MIVAALAAAAVIAAGAGAVFRRKRTHREPSVPVAPTGEAITSELHALVQSIDGKVPAAVLARVTRISAVVDETVPRLSQLGPGSADAHAVLRTATSYVPEALRAYLRLPRRFADTRKISGSKTALAVLCDQLDLLAAKMDDVYDAVCRADAAALVAHGQFLADKFARGSLAIDVAAR